MNEILYALGVFLVGAEKVDRDNTKLKDSVIANDLVAYKQWINKGYNPFRMDAEYKRPYEYSENKEFERLASEWVNELAYSLNPEIDN